MSIVILSVITGLTAKRADANIIASAVNPVFPNLQISTFVRTVTLAIFVFYPLENT